MTPQSFTDTWTWSEEPEIYGPDTDPSIAGRPTGNVLVTVVTVAAPEGYTIALPETSTPFQRAMAVQALWEALGRPA